jgi:ABC-type transport system substrate-binding protein
MNDGKSYGEDIGLDLAVAIPNPIINTEPDKVTIAQEKFIIPLLYEGLFNLNEDGAISPALAKGWTFDPRSKILNVIIGNDSMFSDGSEVKVDDILATFNLLCSQKSKIRDLLQDLDGCSESQPQVFTNQLDRSISFRIKYQPTSFLYRLASHPVLIFKQSKNGKVLGSGPYQIEFKDHIRLSIVPNGMIKNPLKKAKHSRITFTYIEEERISEVLKEQQYDLAAMYLSSTGQRLEIDNYKEYYHSPSVTQTLILNPAFAPFASKSTRQQIRDKIHSLDISSCNPGSIAAKGFIPPGVGGSLTKRDSNPPDFVKPISDKSDKKKYSVTIYEHKDRRSSCEEKKIVEALAAMEIDARLQYEPSYKEMGPRRGHKATPAYVELFVFPSRDASTSLRRFLPGTQEPYFFYTKKAYQDLLHEAMNRPNLTDRFDIYREINKDIYEEAVVIPLYYIGHVNFIKTCLEIKENHRGIFISPNSFSYLEKIRRGKKCN